MQLKDFSIGMTFVCGNAEWICTDVGSRVVVAIQATGDSWENGPPYAVAEHVFDEYDLEGCMPAEEKK